jgi:predicted dehydrogenase
MTSSFDVTRREFLGISFATSTALARPSVARLVSPPPVRIAVLGAGARGRSCLATLQGMPWATVDLLIDPSKHSRSVALQECFARGMSPVDSGADGDALASDDVTAIVLAAPARENARLALAGIEAGKHLYIEPPAAMDAATLVRIAHAAAATGRVVQHGTPLLSSSRRRMLDGDGVLNRGRIRYTIHRRGSASDMSEAIPSTLQHEIDFAARLLRVSRVEDATAVISPIHSPGRTPQTLKVAYLTLAGQEAEPAFRYLSIELRCVYESPGEAIVESSLEVFSRGRKWLLTGTASLQAPAERFNIGDRRLHLGNFLQAVRRRRPEGLRAPVGRDVLAGYAISEAAAAALADAHRSHGV